MKKILIFLLLLLSPISITPLKAYEVIPGGENIGVEINANGVLVIGSYDVVVKNITYNPSKDSDILKNDLIVKANNDKISSIKDLLNSLKKITTNSVDLQIKRNDKVLSRNLKLIETSKAKTFKTGLLVKECILGIGTMTFYDANTKIFGALGHKLIDNDFATIADVNSGTIYNSTVVGINKSKNNNVGEILANIKLEEALGKVEMNTDYGIYGHYNTCPDKDALIVAKKEEVTLGKAYIYTELKENDIQKYEIEIVSLERQDKIASKGISFKITDKNLVNKAGGIVQGMSGSPIIQNGKIVGAVTHVLVDNVKKGYGIYLETMLNVCNIGI